MNNSRLRMIWMILSCKPMTLNDKNILGLCIAWMNLGIKLRTLDAMNNPELWMIWTTMNQRNKSHGISSTPCRAQRTWLGRHGMDAWPNWCWSWSVCRNILVHIVCWLHVLADYKKSKSEDIMSFMLTLFEQADFIKEVQSLLGERLLSVGYDNTELEKEVSVWFGQLSLSWICTYSFYRSDL